MSNIITSSVSGLKSETSSGEVDVVEFEFSISNGNTGILSISDPLLDLHGIAEARAKSEFLKNSYKLRKVEFKTHITGIKLNQVIEIEGLPYIIKSKYSYIDGVKMIMTFIGVRYD